MQDFIIGPAIEQCGYEMPPIRADQIASPGRITKQIIDHLLNDALVIADLTDHNPNVFYELAVRHAIRKPIVQIIHKSQTIPFDVGTQRTIFYDHQNLREAPRTIKEIIAQIKAAERDPGNVDTPLSDAIFQQSLSESSDPVQKSNAEILTLLHEIRSNTVHLQKNEGWDAATCDVEEDLIDFGLRIEEEFKEHMRAQSLARNGLAERGNENVAKVKSTIRQIQLVQGDRVKHKHFGIGTVVNREGTSMVHVAFPSPVGLKKLDVGYVTLVRT